MALAPYNLAAGQRHYLGNWKGWAMKVSTFLGPNSSPFTPAVSGPEKVSTFMAQPFQWPEKWICPHQTHYIQGRINQKSIGSFMYMSSHRRIFWCKTACLYVWRWASSYTQTCRFTLKNPPQELPGPITGWGAGKCGKIVHSAVRL